MRKKERIDVLLVKKGLFDSREQAKRAVMAGDILGDNEERLDKPGTKIYIDTNLHFKGKKMPYVSRGGLKLEKALQSFNLSVRNKTVLDIGSSTGGFTDVSLKNGARLVYALDVGTNQLSWKLRQDVRTIVMENTNFRYSKLSDFKNGQPEFSTIDVSFISLELILKPLYQILINKGDVIALIKPQFEAGKQNVGKNGIIRNPKIHKAVINKVMYFARYNYYDIYDLNFSPITGGHGNIEFLIHLKKSNSLGRIMRNIDVESVVKAAHASFN